MATTFTNSPDPLTAAAHAPGRVVLAVISGVEGPSYRPVGAMMAVMEDGSWVGTLSSGCIEADIAHHAATALATARTRFLRYGNGSPFRDIELPCGGGLDIFLVPDPDRTALAEALRRRDAREELTMTIKAATGAIALGPPAPSGRSGGTVAVHLMPDLRFLVFGKGPETVTFAALARASGFGTRVYSPDEETLAACGGATTHLRSQDLPPGLIAADDRTAIVLFFHDHEWEPQILLAALKTPAFYIGAQGSRRARQARDAVLRAEGTGKGDIARIRGPIGLVASARDARTLAISVLAEVLSLARSGPRD